MTSSDLPIGELQDRYRRGVLTPVDLAQEVLDRCDGSDPAIWISRVAPEVLLAAAQRLVERGPSGLPLWGVPFAVKDNIDAAGLPTTAACPAYAYQPEQDAFVVRRLLDAGALLIGKTNLDQFATGLVGTRTPYGIPGNAFDPAYVPGGSSSGSAVAVARGLVSFALGTDTAGSGRVPAAFNNLVGLKPSCGLLSTTGVVPACRSLDCVSIFAVSARDARAVLDVAAGFDADDAYSRALNIAAGDGGSLAGRRFAVPEAAQLQFFGNEDAVRLFAEFCDRLAAAGANLTEIDFSPFAETAALLYQGPWLAERYLAVGGFIEQNPDAAHPVTRDIILAGRTPTAADTFEAFYRLAALRRAVAPVWEQVDALLTPTAGTIYTIDDLLADPVQLNSNLGAYTNFVNLLDLAAVAVPAGFLPSGLPFGVSFSAPAGSDHRLLSLAAALDGAPEDAAPEDGAPEDATTAAGASGASRAGRQPIAVCGAHMSGLPLNKDLLALGGTLRGPARTTADYRLYALPDLKPARPGLVRVGEGQGAAIEVEVWDIPCDQVGPLLAQIAAPLGLGSVALSGGDRVHGFLCEAWAVRRARDITEFGGWRAYAAT